MYASIAVPTFSEAGIRKIFTEAGLVDVDVVVLKEKLYMEFGGNKLFRTVFLAQGKRPVDGEDKSEQQQQQQQQEGDGKKSEL